MTPMQRDPEDNELRYLRRCAPMDGRRILDIGCGDGDLTRRFAPEAAQVLGVDPLLSKVRQAAGARPGALAGKLHLGVARGQALPVPEGQFDLVFFTSSF